MLSVKIYRNLKRNLFYGIYFNKFHAICKGKFQKCDHIYLAIHSHSALIFRLRCISMGTYKVRNEIETKRNQRKRNETKRNQQKRNETKSTK